MMNLNYPADYSTLNMAVLEALPNFVGAGRISDQMGQGCFLDAPGFPSYFLRAVYNSRGDVPDSYPQAVIALPNGMQKIVQPSVNNTWREGDTWDTVTARHAAVLRSLWSPLPLDHPRVQAWIDYLYGYFRNCYIDRAKGSRKVQDLLKYRPDDYTVEDHAATALVRDFYPDFEPTEENIERGCYGRPNGTWWEILAEKPTPENCPGDENMGRHPMNGKWCQVCGWKEEKREVAVAA